MISTFLYPSSPKSPHPVHLTWAKSVCKYFIRTPMKTGIAHVLSLFSRFDVTKIPYNDVLLLESLYCLPFARRYKKRVNPKTKIISIIADTSFWKKKMTLSRRVYYKLYLDYVDGFIAVSEKIKKDIQEYIERPVEVVRPFLVHKYNKRKTEFNKKILFIGNEVKEKGFLKLVEAMKFLPKFELFLVGNCYKAVDKIPKNVHVEGRVKSLNPYFNECSFYVHPADFDPYPVSVFEAMYAGLIPIITKNVGQAEILKKEGLNELILENNKPETIAEKILEIENKSVTWKKTVSKRCKEIAERYTKEKSVKEFKKAFKKLLNKIR